MQEFSKLKYLLTTLMVVYVEKNIENKEINMMYEWNVSTFSPVLKQTHFTPLKIIL